MSVMNNTTVNEAGHLVMAGCDMMDLVKKYGTPIYVMDEALIRQRCRIYKSAMEKAYKGRALPVYASKAFCTVAMCRIISEEGLGLDVSSGGELYTAVKANFPMERVLMHSNNKTYGELQLAVQNGVGRIVVDNFEELRLLDEIAKRFGKKVDVLLRINPGIDCHTLEKIATAQEDSKFGVDIAVGAKEFIKAAQEAQNLNLKGIHCHVGSQISDLAPFEQAAQILVDFILEVNATMGIALSELDLGGGFSVVYTEGNPAMDYAACIAAVGKLVCHQCYLAEFPAPFVYMEPGRSIVGDAGLTLYTVGNVKELAGIRNYVAIDGGMTDNPRYALYGAPYTLLLANRANQKKDYSATVVGKCCESGDMIQENARIQKPQCGDTMAVLCTGAYNYSMASNYNRIPRPPVVMVSEGKDRLIVRRESYDDITKNDLL